jgi:hypothetical protein
MAKIRKLLQQHARAVQAIRYVVSGLFVTFCLLGLKVLFEHSTPGHRVELWSYEFLQGQLSAIEPNPLPVVVVDISGVPGGTETVSTSRDKLTELIEAIAKQQPKAIGVDGDLSPGPNGWIDANKDPDFFDFCLNTRTDRHVPVFLGIHRTLASPPNTWLGLDDYKELAVVLLIHDDTTRLPIWVRQIEGNARLEALGSALAQAYRGGPLPQPPRWLQSITETTEEPPTDASRSDSSPIAVTSAIVNYSKLEQIEATTLLTISRQSVNEAASLFRGRVVIIGKARDAMDRYIVLRRQGPSPVVY